MDGCDRGFAFITEPPQSAFVLDEWSYTIIDCIHQDSFEYLESNLPASEEFAQNLNKTIKHLVNLGLLESSKHVDNF